ncbi:hypothetical protein [Ancylobacter polymorphus]|uniref:Uncharacterized protein n=1 Tax=Ancylobacter polymorphus TaxID=223390 RepID=A0A9E6ZS58_9HYPH|nr:hypothetical protein [Ancylobacter polymorphus]UOK69496.1 hypothetical protein K9D25_12080 [Ancylobacter polymorphus]
MRLRWLRLLLALCALGAALASPVAAARAIAAPGPAVSDPVLPCHETASEAAQAAAQASQTVTPAQKPAASHLCCVLTQAVVPPLTSPALPVPEAVSARPAVPAETTRAGLAPRIPVPPPRVL